MRFIPSVIVLFVLALIRQPIPCESLKCYQLSVDRVVECAGKCLSYLDENDNGTMIQRCCSDRCDIEGNHTIYSCSKDRCNGLHSDRKLLAMNKSLSPRRILRKRADEESGSSLSCYECSNHNPACGTDEQTIARGCRACLVFRNTYDNNNVLRRCCTSGCGEPDTIGDYEGRTAYFCGSDLCNGIGSEDELPTEEVTSTTLIAASTTVTTTLQTISQCYDCSGPQCGKEGSFTSGNCPSCMAYRDPNDQSKIERRCCWWACGAPNTVSTYNGVETYFCTGDKCNGDGVESMLSPPTFTATASSVTTTTQQTVSLCYECSGPECGQGGASLSGNCPSCMLYRNPNDQTKIERRCCWWACGAPNTVGMYNGMETYFCVGDECNGYNAESILSPPITTTITTTISLSTVPMFTTTMQTSFQCHQCSGSNCGKDSSTLSGNCPSCMAYRNPNDQTIIERRCCWTNCGPSNSVKMYEGMETYFCTGDGCNRYGAEFALSPPASTTPTTPMTTTGAFSTFTMSTTTMQTSFQCHQCSGSNCGRDSSTLSGSCPSCMAYRNPNDPTIIERRCCWTNCGPSNSVKMHEGMETYFCTGDGCNRYGVEFALSPPPSTTPTTPMTTTVAFSTVTTSTTTIQTSFQCHQCSGSNCGRDSSTLSGNCPSCMAYRNPNDQTIIERRCCWTNCGPSNSVMMYEGMETYFCTGDGCNRYGVEYALSPPVTTTTARTMQTSTVTLSTIVTTLSTMTTTSLITTASFSTVTTSTTTMQTAFQCHQCSGPNCGKDSSTLSGSCPSCMAYRNPSDQTIIERRCCWWDCGPSNSVKMYEGVETYFCTGDACNRYGVEFALSPAVTTTVTSTVTVPITTATSTMTFPTTTATSTMTIPTTTTGLMTTSTSSGGTCTLNCQNGGIPETVDGCFCYCLDNTYGRECENINCAAPDIDSSICTSENQPLCVESENFALECHHLCGKC